MPLSINSLGRFSFSINDGAGGTVYDKEFDVIARGASDAAIRNVSDGHLIRIPLGSQVGGTIPATQAALINALIRAVSGAPSAALRFNATGTALVGPDGKARKRIAVGITGQSNERGQGPLGDTVNTSVYVSSVDPRVRVPILGTVSRLGSMVPPMYDALRALGIDADFFNGAIGGSSQIKDWTGQCQYRGDSAPYFQRRVPYGQGDAGAYGDVILESGKVFVCTTGNFKYASYRGTIPIIGSTDRYFDYVIEYGSALTAASPPTFSSATLGSTVIDGDIVWTCVEDGNAAGLTSGGLLPFGSGLDSYGLMDRTTEGIQAISAVTDRWVIVCGGQSDVQGNEAAQSTVQGWYTTALILMATTFIERGIGVAIGLSVKPTADPTYQWDTLSAGVDAALAYFAGNARVGPAANLYDHWGSSPPLQGDGIHLTNAGLIEAGQLHAAALAALIDAQ